jgi:hypothetical protein
MHQVHIEKFIMRIDILFVPVPCRRCLVYPCAGNDNLWSASKSLYENIESPFELIPGGNVSFEESDRRATFPFYCRQPLYCLLMKTKIGNEDRNSPGI